MSRVAVFMFDSIEREYVERLIARGELPHLERLRGRSVRVELRCPPDYRAESPWTSFVTGRSPADLGYWTTVRFDPATYECVASGAADAEPFWDTHRSSIVIDIPHCRLATSPSVKHVIGWGTHDPQYCRCSNPSGLLTRIEASFGPHPAIPLEFFANWNTPSFTEQLSSALLRGIERRAAIVSWLIETTPSWELLLVGLGEAHQAGHLWWHGVDRASPAAELPGARSCGEALLAVHRALDASLGSMLSQLPSDCSVVVASIKGMQGDDVGSLPSLLLPELLSREHLGVRRFRSPNSLVWRLRGSPRVFPELGGWDTTFAEERWVQSRTLRLGRWAGSRVSRMKGRARRALGRTGPPPEPQPPETTEGIGPTVAKLEWNIACWYRDDWPRMPLFVIPSFSDTHLRVNLVGRERHGIVPPSRYGAVIDRLEALLGELRDSRDGSRIELEVIRTRGAGPLDSRGPPADVIVRSRQSIDSIRHPRHGLIGPFPASRTGTHSTNGFAYFSGPGIRAGDLGRFEALSLTPTIMALLGEAMAPGAAPIPIDTSALAVRE